MFVIQQANLQLNCTFILACVHSTATFLASFLNMCTLAIFLFGHEKKKSDLMPTKIIV